MARKNRAPQFVGIFPVNARHEVLLQLRDDRPDLDGPNSWGTLGGVIEDGESAEAAAHRELWEECGRHVLSLVPLGFVDRSLPGETAPFRYHTYATAVDWTLADVILGEGQAMAWWPVAHLDSVPLASWIADDIRTLARSEAVESASQSAPPARPEPTSALTSGDRSVLALAPGQLVAVHGATAAFAAALRTALPTSARLTATPGRTERPQRVLWWPDRVSDLAPLHRSLEHAAADARCFLFGPSRGTRIRVLLVQNHWQQLAGDVHLEIAASATVWERHPTV